MTEPVQPEEFRLYPVTFDRRIHKVRYFFAVRKRREAFRMACRLCTYRWSRNLGSHHSYALDFQGCCGVCSRDAAIALGFLDAKLTYATLFHPADRAQMRELP